MIILASSSVLSLVTMIIRLAVALALTMAWIAVVFASSVPVATDVPVASVVPTTTFGQVGVWRPGSEWRLCRVCRSRRDFRPGPDWRPGRVCCSGHDWRTVRDSEWGCDCDVNYYLKMAIEFLDAMDGLVLLTRILEKISILLRAFLTLRCTSRSNIITFTPQIRSF